MNKMNNNNNKKNFNLGNYQNKSLKRQVIERKSGAGAADLAYCKKVVLRYKNKINLFICSINILSILLVNLSRQFNLVQSIAVQNNRSNHRQHSSASNSSHQLVPNSIYDNNYHNNNNNLNVVEKEQQSKSDNANNDEYLSPSINNTNNNDNNDHDNLVGQTNALMYLKKYGYIGASLSPSAAASVIGTRRTSFVSNSNLNSNFSLNQNQNQNQISEESFKEAIRSFQKFAGLPQTGLVDGETERLMQMPRCGNVDKQTTTAASRQLVRKSGGSILNVAGAGGWGVERRKRRRRRRKRYALQGSKWRRQELTYRISQYPTRFNGKRQEVDAQIEKAFGIWSHVAPIKFVVKGHGRVHIDIRFASGDHGDGDAFDGPGNTLAHAYFPQYGGDAHFDDQEYWTIDSYAGTNIFQVAAHELGHSLGLGHSNIREALMAPFYQKYKPNFKLHIDDILAIQALYGEKPLFLQPDVPQTTPIAAPTTSTPSAEQATTGGGPTTTTTTTPKPLFKQQTTTSFSLFPGAFNVPTMKSNPSGSDGDVHSAGSENDIFTNKPPNSFKIPLYPASLPSPASSPEGAGGVERNNTNGELDLCLDSMIDAITRTEDGRSYVFKGDSYWLLTNDGLARGYPRKIFSDWEGLPNNLDAALTWADGKTFFFKGNKYWRFRNRKRDIGYPKLISAGFAGIPNDIDAAFVWSGNGRTYIFKGTEYWRFDSKSNPPVSSEYPKPIKVWTGVPSHINAAFKWENNVTYFFKGQQYYRFNDKEFKLEQRGRPPFPRNTAEWWFGCINSNSLLHSASASASASALEQFNSNFHNGPSSSSTQPFPTNHWPSLQSNFNFIDSALNNENKNNNIYNNNNLLEGIESTSSSYYDSSQNAINQNNQRASGRDQSKQTESNANDWSFFTGVIDGTKNIAKLPGTHISDHEIKPETNLFSAKDGDFDESDIFYHRSGVFNNFFTKQLPKSFSFSTSSSSSSSTTTLSSLSAISNYNLISLISVFTTTTLVFVLEKKINLA